MTRKHYRAVAEELRGELQVARGMPGVRVGIMRAAYALCTVFKMDNPRFDRERFIAAVRADDPS